MFVPRTLAYSRSESLFITVEILPKMISYRD